MPTFLNTHAIVNRRELLSTFFNDDTIGRSKENKDWLFLTMSMSLVIKIFILENLFLSFSAFQVTFSTKMTNTFIKNFWLTLQIEILKIFISPE